MVNDAQDGHSLQMRGVPTPTVPSRLDLSKPSHTNFVADLALSFLLLPVDEICKNVNDAVSNVSDDLSLAADIVLKRSQQIVSSAITVASRNVSTANTPTEEIPKKHIDEEYVANEEEKQDSTKKIETDNSPLRISKMLQNVLPSDSHPVFRHYTASPQVIVCGHTAIETMEELLAHRSREQRNVAQCDSIVVGVVPSREGTLLVLPSPVVSAVTNFDSVHMPVVDDKLDGILRNRVDNDANRVLSSFDDATDYSGNTCFWMDKYDFQSPNGLLLYELDRVESYGFDYTKDKRVTTNSAVSTSAFSFRPSGRIISGGVELNHEGKQNAFVLSVVVLDSGTPALRSHSQVSVFVSDLNEPPVIYDQMRSVFENANDGAWVGTKLDVSDPDFNQGFDFIA
jgi:hypothetical protein